MRKSIKYILLLLIILLGNIKVYAESCDSDDIQRLKVLAENVEVSYEKDENAVLNGLKVNNVYSVYFNNMTDEMYVVDSKKGINYDTITDGVLRIDGVNNNGKSIKYKIYSKNCNKSLRSLYVRLPFYNVYYNEEICKDYKDLDFCQEYTTEVYTYGYIENAINDLNKKDETDENNENGKNKKIIISVVIVLVCLLIVFVIFKVLRDRKRGKLE